VVNWKARLEKLGFMEKDHLFPQIPSHFDQHNMLAPDIQKTEIQSNTTIRTIFKRAFAAAGVRYLRPHSFRHTIVRWAETQTPEVFNAVRQSLGHSSVETTFNSYGMLPPTKIGQIMGVVQFTNGVGS
jgi:integrase